MGVRQSWVYPSDGSEPYEKGSRPERMVSVSGGVMIAPDLPDFVSSVDGKLYSGRAGMREHNRRNDVVPLEDLKGLPHLQTNSDIRSPQEKRAYMERRKELIINQVNKHYR
jgi:hypothetical protein